MEDLRHSCKSCGRLTLANILESRGGICIQCSRAEQERNLRDSLSQAGQSYYSTAGMLLANKSHEYRSRVLSRAQAIAEFYTESGLATSDLHVRFNASPETFSFDHSDLTDLGVTFSNGTFQRWLKNIDRWAESADRSAAGYKASLRRTYVRHSTQGG